MGTSDTFIDLPIFDTYRIPALKYQKIEYQIQKKYRVPISAIGTVWYNTVQNSRVQYGSVRYSRVQCGMIWFSIVQYSTV
jgi:hypothetical protein